MRRDAGCHSCAIGAVKWQSIAIWIKSCGCRQHQLVWIFAGAVHIFVGMLQICCSVVWNGRGAVLNL